MDLGFGSHSSPQTISTRTLDQGLNKQHLSQLLKSFRCTHSSQKAAPLKRKNGGTDLLVYHHIIELVLVLISVLRTTGAFLAQTLTTKEAPFF